MRLPLGRLGRLTVALVAAGVLALGALGARAALQGGDAGTRRQTATAASDAAEALAAPLERRGRRRRRRTPAPLPPPAPADDETARRPRRGAAGRARAGVHDPHADAARRRRDGGDLGARPARRGGSQPALRQLAHRGARRGAARPRARATSCRCWSGSRAAPGSGCGCASRPCRTARRAGCRGRRSAATARSTRTWSSTASGCARRWSATASRSSRRRSAIGTDAAPTPAGQFYVRVVLSRYASPFYGPVAFGTSARSAVLTDWPAGGFVGIHGTDQPELDPRAASRTAASACATPTSSGSRGSCRSGRR